MNYFYLPLEEWTNYFVDNILLPYLSGFFDGISSILQTFVDGLTDLLLAIPPEIIVILLILLVWKLGGKGIALLILLGSIFIGSIDMWEESIQTMSIIIISTIISVVIGIPLGILCAANKIIDSIVKPTLDFMQTLPIFVYLIPAILLFGLGAVPAIFATVVFAAPPAVRMTSLGIKEVPNEVVEAGKAFGTTSKQLLFKVQLPLAMKPIMTGVNQTIMLALSMAVVASMIGAPGLGSVVLRGITQVNVGLGLTSGLAIVVMAIILDRITQNISEKIQN